MDIKTLSPQVSVSPQITAADVAKVTEAGFRAIICNRPDGEGADQPNFDEIEAAANAVGLRVAYVPVTAGMVRDDDVAAFASALAELPRPVLAYCRTGNRSAIIFNAAQA